jgi:hypothetical protein
VIKPIPMPLFKNWLRRSFTAVSLVPPSHVALEERSVNCPCDEVSDRFIVVKHSICSYTKGVYSILSLWIRPPEPMGASPGFVFNAKRS